MSASSIASFVAALLFIGSVFGQAKEITQQEYFDAYSTALNTVLTRSHRKVQVTEYFENGRKTRTVEEIEEIQNGARRTVHTEIVGTKRARDEMVEIAGVYYCRVGVRPWKKSATDCAFRGVRLSGSSEDVEGETHYTTEQVKLNTSPVTLLRNFITFNPTGKGAGHVWENRAWIDRSFLILRREYKTGVSAKTYTSLVETYEYNPKLSIRPPIK